jgi:hypothetical protein
MSLVEEALVLRLEAFGGLTALIGAAPSRLYPVLLPQLAALPAVTYQEVSNDGRVKYNSQSGMAKPRYQIDCWAFTYATAAAVAEQVRLALASWISTVSGVVVDAVRTVGERDTYDPVPKVFRRSLDFFIWHQEALA